MTNIRKDEEKFVKHLTSYLVSRLSGDYVKDTVIMTRPSREFIIGCLSATFTKETYQRTIAKTNSIAVSFLVESFKELELDLSGSLFYPISEATELEDYSQTEWKKKNFYFNSIKITKPDSPNPIQLDFEDIISEIKEDFNKFKIKKDKIPDIKWGIDISVKVNSYTQGNKELKLVTVYIINKTHGEKKDKKDELKPVRDYDTSIFNIELIIRLKTDITPFKFDYEYEGYPEEYESDIKTLNCGAEYKKSDKLIKTTFVKVFKQPLILPKNELTSLDGQDKIPLSFKELIEPIKTKKLLNIILLHMNNYLSHYKKNKSASEKYGDLTKNFENIIKKFTEGIECLNDPKIMKAFNLMQRTFLMKDQSQKTPFGSWRLFQLVYIVNLITDLININKNHQEASVLHVDTGGGKSEAYFGLVVFSAFLDRLDGKNFGVTAITKFPLRMLSIQQLQRIASIFAWAEEIRKEENIEGRFTLGYLVGESSDFPNNNYTIVNQILKANEDKKEVNGKILTDCPICNHKNNIKLEVEGTKKLIFHKCKSCRREFHLYFCDDEVYRSLPTFIVSTVDKMAAVGMQRKVKNLFGGDLDECQLGHGYMPHKDICNYEEKYRVKCKSPGKPVNISFNTSPRLIIQDEMHLIRESFGTIDSHFETFLETMAYEFKGRFFKNIAMTATICGASDQIKQLYNKETEIFPSESPEGKGINDFFFEKYREIHRLIIGLTPNMIDNQSASLTSLKIIVEYISEIEKDQKQFSDKIDITSSSLSEILKYYKSYLTYHNRVSDVNGMSYFLEPKANSKLREIGYSLHKHLLTSALSLDEIKEIINEIMDWDKKHPKEDIPVCFATNLVSHGVDIDKWNLMIFQGIPRSAAEYIQALSRVGRQHVGLVINWFYPNRIRDQSYFQNFREFHEILSHHVERVPIARWAKLGFHQTFNTLFCAAILNYMSNKLGRPLYSLSDYRNTFCDVTNLEHLKTFLKKAYNLSLNIPGSKYFFEQIEIQVEERHSYLMSYTGQGKEIYFFPNCLSDSSNPYFKMQRGMRGIQDNIELGADDLENTFVNRYKKNYQEEDERDD